MHKPPRRVEAVARLQVFSSSCTTNVVFSGVAADGFELLVDDDVSRNDTLEMPSKASALKFLSSHVIAAAAPNYLGQA